MSGQDIGSFYRLQPGGEGIPVYGSSFIRIVEKDIGSIYTKMRGQGSCIGSSYDRIVDRLMYRGSFYRVRYTRLCHDWI